MFIHKFFRLHNDNPGESGSTAVVDRGDLLIPEDTDLDPDNPDAKLDAPVVDPKVAELEAEVLADAVQKIWPLMGYALKERLSNTAA